MVMRSEPDRRQNRLYLHGKRRPTSVTIAIIEKRLLICRTSYNQRWTKLRLNNILGNEK